MENKSTLAGLVGGLILLACEQSLPPRKEALSTRHASRANAAEAVVPLKTAPATQAGSSDEGNPKPTSPPLGTEAEHGIEGARNVLLSFARAIEQGQYGQAWALLGPAVRQKWSRSDLAGLFADLRDIVVAIPDGTMEGAAGSLFYTAPVTVTGNDRDGRPARIEGEAVLRRVNNVDGATPAQLLWHFEALTLDRTQ